MEHKVLAGSVRIPVIGLGTWGVGGFWDSDGSRDDQAVYTIRTALDLGYSHIDTAEVYASGHAEELVGEAIRGYERSRLLITSKVGKKNLAHDDVIASCTKSLTRLATPYIDVYLIHAPNPDVPLEETMRAMDVLVEHGMVRYIGVSNFSVGQMREAQRYSKNRIVVN